MVHAFAPVLTALAWQLKGSCDAVVNVWRNRGGGTEAVDAQIRLSMDGLVELVHVIVYDAAWFTGFPTEVPPASFPEHELVRKLHEALCPGPSAPARGIISLNAPAARASFFFQESLPRVPLPAMAAGVFFFSIRR